MLRQTHQQKLLQKLSPQQIQLMKLLQIPTTHLEERIKEEMEENPALEYASESDGDPLHDLDDPSEDTDYESGDEVELSNDQAEKIDLDDFLRREDDEGGGYDYRSEEHTSELQSRPHLVCRLLLEKKKN